MPEIDRRELGRRLTRLANASVGEVLAIASHEGARAMRIGLTGPPGAGKSSLCGRLALLRAQVCRVGVLAIDPSSPISGGAILGDRIRMDELDGAERLYVRSLASRSAHDGLADNLPEMLHAMDEAGFAEVILETVGVGQTEHAVRSQVDTLVLVTHPETGDSVQAMKAGIMEIPDIYVVHKGDLPGAPRVASELTRAVALGRSVGGGWTPPVLVTSIREPASIDRLSAEIDRHAAWLAGEERRAARRVAQARYRLRSLLERRVAESIEALPAGFFDQPLSAQYSAAIAAMRGEGR